MLNDDGRDAVGHLFQQRRIQVVGVRVDVGIDGFQPCMLDRRGDDDAGIPGHKHLGPRRQAHRAQPHVQADAPLGEEETRAAAEEGFQSLAEGSFQQVVIIIHDA